MGIGFRIFGGELRSATRMLVFPLVPQVYAEWLKGLPGLREPRRPPLGAGLALAAVPWHDEEALGDSPRARGSATAESDYDCLLVVEETPDEAVQMELVLARPPQVNPHFETASGLVQAVSRGRAPALNMILQGQVIWGELPPAIESAARDAVRRLGLIPRPDIGKGVWLAREGFPADVPREMRDRSEEKLLRLAPNASALERAAVCDDFLRSLVATRLQGDLRLDRTRLLELLHEFVLDGADFEALRACLDGSDQGPSRIRDAVREHLERIYGAHEHPG